MTFSRGNFLKLNSDIKQFFLPHTFFNALKKLWNREMLLLRKGSSELAISMGVGVFIGFSPLLGFHTILCLLFAKISRKSFIGAFIGSSLPTGIPWLIPGVYFISYRLGLILLGMPYNFGFFEKFKHINLDKALVLIRNFGKPLLTGCTVMGLFWGTITFFIVKYVETRIHNKRNET